MKNRNKNNVESAIILLLICIACTTSAQVLDVNKMAKKYYGEDAQWFVVNTPFFECSDKQMEQVYYYRWKMYKAHLRNTGQNQFVITEFINDVTWDRDPYSTINAASMHHIYEGRWLKDDRYMNGYINYMFGGGGNNRSYSESVADAAYARYLVNADKDFIISQLDSMKSIYNAWNDHYDSSKQLYYIPAMPDATEYTIASVDASNGTGGFDSGDAFRPTINSYMFGNAMAIGHVALLKGDYTASVTYFLKAADLKHHVEEYLWNNSLQHFTDRFKQNNQYVHYWDFIRGRELAGMIPWYFNLPADSSNYNAAWKHVIDTSQLLGQYGLRTNEPSYEYYFKQFVMYMGQRGSQWNGPSWPYQSSQAITAMANFLNNYTQDVVTAHDYINLLRLFTQQHYLPNGKINLVENYDPNLGGPIVYYYWSNHYNHSSYNNLIITGLCGIRPSENDTLCINPISDSSISYFCIDGVSYHGHRLTVAYDKTGNKYKTGKGLSVFIDGEKSRLLKQEDKFYVVVGPPVIKNIAIPPANYALNIRRKNYPVPAASVNAAPDTSIYQAIDGRIWYFSEITNRWTTEGSTAESDWYAIDFGAMHELSSVKLYLFTDDKTFAVPDAVNIEYKNGAGWKPVKMRKQNNKSLTGNTANTIMFNKITASAIKIYFKHGTKQVAVSEIECY